MLAVFRSGLPLRSYALPGRDSTRAGRIRVVAVGDLNSELQLADEQYRPGRRAGRRPACRLQAHRQRRRAGQCLTLLDDRRAAGRDEAERTWRAAARQGPQLERAIGFEADVDQ